MAHIFELFTVQELVFCLGVVLIASIIQMVIGMGFGMLASPLIALIRPEIVPGAIITMGLVVAFFGSWKERKNISYMELKLGTTGRIVGCGVALALLMIIPNINVFLITFGIIMLVAVLITASGLQLEFNNTNFFRSCGRIASCIFCGVCTKKV